MIKYNHLLFCSLMFASEYSFADCDGLGGCAAYFTSTVDESYTVTTKDESFTSVPQKDISQARRWISTQAKSFSTPFFSKEYTLKPSSHKDRTICFTFISRKQFDPSLYIKYGANPYVWLIQDGGPGDAVSVDIEGVGKVGIQINVVHSLGKSVDGQCQIEWPK